MRVRVRVRFNVRLCVILLYLCARVRVSVSVCASFSFCVCVFLFPCVRARARVPHGPLAQPAGPTAGAVCPLSGPTDCQPSGANGGSRRDTETGQASPLCQVRGRQYASINN